MRKKLILILLVLSLCTGAFSLAAVVGAEALTPGNSVSPGYSYSFSGREGFSTDYLSGVYESCNMAVNGDGMGMLGPGVQNQEPNDITGYVIYRVSAAAGRTLETLSLDFRGRIFHFEHTQGDNCGLEVSAASSLDSLQSVILFQAGTDGSSKNYSVPLSELASGNSQLFVKITMRGSSWSWVGLESLSFPGTENAAQGEVMLRLDRQPMQPEVARIGVPYSLIGCSVVNAEQGDLTVSVRDSLGNPVSVADGSVTLAQPGVYSVIYGVTGSDVTLTYTVAVPRTLQGDWTQPENLLQSDNYYTTGSVTGEETLSISGSAVYLQQVDFDSSQKNRVKVRFDCSGVTEGQTFSIALKRSPGLADFNSCTDAGLYFTFTATTGGISVKGIFSDGENTSLLGVNEYARPANGAHAIEIRRYNGDPNYADGAELYVDGIRFSDWLGYSVVKLSAVAPDNTAYLAYETSGGSMELLAASNTDNFRPTLELETDLAESAYVGDAISLPRAIAYDTVDGEMPYTVTVRDPYGNEELLIGDTYVPLYRNRYTFTYTTCDFSGNEYSRNFRITVYLRDGAPAFLFEQTPSENGRLNTTYFVPIPDVENLNGGTFAFAVEDPDGLPVAAGMDGAFVPQKLGRYVIRYEAENEVGANRAAYFVYVKNNVDESQSYEYATQADQWQGADLVQTDAGVQFWGDGYYTRQIPMGSGVEITMQLSALADKNSVDCWLSLALMAFPDYGDFANQRQTGLYFMFFRQGSTYYYNVLTYNSYGQAVYIGGGTAIGSNLDTVVLRVERYSGGDISLQNTIAIYVNDQKNENYSVYNVAYSDLVDNEDFTYLAVGAYGDGGKETRSGVITKVFFADHIAPEVVLNGEWISQGKVGERIQIPEIALIDNVDTEFYQDVKLYDPEGNIVTWDSDGLLLEKAGLYSLVIKAVDASGNKTVWIRQISALEGGGTGGGCNTCAAGCGGAAAAIALAAAGILLIGKKK